MRIEQIQRMTTAALDPDEPLSRNLCLECDACVVACPVDAISQPGRTHAGRCVRQVLPHGLTGLIKYLTESIDRSREEIKESFLVPDFWNMYQSLQLGLVYGCHACINACPVGQRPK